MVFERECGCWSQLAVIYREKLAECLEGLERLMSPLLYQLSYTATGLYLLKNCGGMISEARWKCLPMDGAESTGSLNRNTLGLSLVPTLF
jgi:hypothetical protein